VRRFADQAILRPNAQKDWLQRRVAAAGYRSAIQIIARRSRQALRVCSRAWTNGRIKRYTPGDVRWLGRAVVSVK
jgi:hypothetical protein